LSESPEVASSEVARESQPSIGGGQVVEIKGSHELGGSPGESPKTWVLQVASGEIVRSEDSHWIQVTGGPLDQEPHRISRIRGFGG
jgi:hypothetical protein